MANTIINVNSEVYITVFPYRPSSVFSFLLTDQVHQYIAIRHCHIVSYLYLKKLKGMQP